MTRNLAYIEVSPQAIVYLATGHQKKFEVIETDVPDDARVVNVAYNQKNRTFAVVVESPSLAEVPDGEKMQMLKGPTMRSVK